MTPAASIASFGDTLGVLSLVSETKDGAELGPEGGIGPGTGQESPAAKLPRIHMACSCTSLLGLLSSDIKVGIASACLNSKFGDGPDRECIICGGNGNCEDIALRSLGSGGAIENGGKGVMDPAIMDMCC